MRPKQRFEYKDLGEYSDAELRQVAHEVCAHVNDEDTERLLRERGRKDTIIRNSDPEGAYENLRRLSNAAQHGEAGGYKAFVIHDLLQRTRGIATIMPELQLRRQKVWLPAGVARRIPVLSDELPTQGPNIAAWLDADVRGSQPLRDAYRFLLDTTEGEGWTIEPNANRSIHRINAIKAAGMHAVGGFNRYDDYESGLYVPPQSQLLIALPTTPRDIA